MNIMVIDYGNSNVKIGIYSKNKLLKVFIFESNAKKEIIYQKIKNVKIEKIYMGAACPNIANVLLKYLVNKFFVPFYIITNQDFKKCFDYKKFNLKEIAPDILSLAYYVKVNFRSGVGFCFGTAYFATIISKNNFEGVVIAPSVELGLNNLIKSAELIKMVPSNYNHYIGNNTIECLSAGARHMLEGFLLNTSQYMYKNYGTKKIIITGGKSHSLLNLKSKFFKFIFVENAIILGYKLIIDETRI